MTIRRRKTKKNNRKHKRKSTNATSQFTKRTKERKRRGQLVRVRVGLSAHVVTTKYTCLVSERHTFNMLRGTMMTMTLSSFVLAAFGLMTTAQSTRMPVSLIK